jgi:hypothetical protein
MGVFRFTRTGAHRGTGALFIDGRQVGEGEIPRTVPHVIETSGEGLCCGYDSGLPVTPDYAAPFRFTGRIDHVVVDSATLPTPSATAARRRDHFTDGRTAAHDKDAALAVLRRSPALLRPVERCRAQRVSTSKPIKLIVPYPPAATRHRRAVLRAALRALGSRGGRQPRRRGGRSAWPSRRSRRATGYTLVIGDLALGHRPDRQPQRCYTQKDFAPIGLVTRSRSWSPPIPSPRSTRRRVLARAKAQPGKLNAGTGGQAGPGHLALELLRTMAGVDIVHVPFKGGAAATTALLGEQVDVVIDGSAMAQVKGGRLKAIAVTGPRLPALPDVPGIGETVKGYEFTNWWGISRLRGRPPAVNRLNQDGAIAAA